MNYACDDVQPLLNARFDNELEEARSAAIDSHLKTCARCAEDFARMQAVRDALRQGLPHRAASPELRDRVRFALRGAEALNPPAPRTHWRLWGGIAAGFILLIAGAAPFLMNARDHRQLLGEELLAAHERALLGSGIDVVSSDRHTVKPWFNGRVPFSPPVVDLAADGFPLAGARLDFADGHPLAALVYTRRLHRIDVFIWPAGSGKEPPANFERNGYNELSWNRGGFVFTAVSDLNPAELASFAALLRARN